MQFVGKRWRALSSETSVTRRGLLGAGWRGGLLCVLGLPAAGALRPPRSRAAVVEPAGPTGVRLFMVEDVGCPYCAKWDREVGVAYAKSAEGRFAPLVRRYRRDPEIAFLKDIVYSPTFVVVQDGTEIGRITGYPAADFFWPMLVDILVKAGFVPQVRSG